MQTLLEILKAILTALGFVPKIVDEVKDAAPKLNTPPPPADKPGLVHDLEERRNRKFPPK